MRFFSIIALLIILMLHCVFMPGVVRAQEALESQSSRDGDVKKLVIPLRIAAIISTTATAVIWSKYYATHKDYENAIEPNEISEYYDNANKYYKLRNGFVFATGLLWAINIATLLINPPPEEVDEFAPYGGGDTPLSQWRVIHDTGDGLSLSWNMRF